MQVKMSKYLKNGKDRVQKLVSLLSEEFEYASVLGVDTIGKDYMVKLTGIDLNDSRWVERGFVSRVYNGYNYSEYSFNEINDELLKDIVNNIKEIAFNDVAILKKQDIQPIPYDILIEDEMKESFYSEVAIHPEDLSHSEKLEKMKKVLNGAFAISDELVECRVRYEEVHVSKIFISTKKSLEQSYIYTTGAIIPIGSRNNQMQFTFGSASGMKGAEVLDELLTIYEKTVKDLIEVLGAESSPHGEFDIICNPSVAGLIAHEAFGHGVEMDMFVKKRAKAIEYIDKVVASEKVTMHDGAKSALEVSSYLFDDEGTLGTDTKIIDKGILKSGISDVLSALKLGTKSTGNGKRESYERKAYARMTNTFFAGGTDKLEDMISSIDRGYLLEDFKSGMEDPKNWGIQCVILMGREIINGKLTGKIIAPVFLTGYVPDLLKSITMVSEEVELSGTGYCGKGHKEFVKTSTGGSYIKARGRLS